MKIILVLCWVFLLVYIVTTRAKRNNEISKVVDAPFNMDFVGGVNSTNIIDTAKFDASTVVRVKNFCVSYFSVLQPEPIKKLFLFFSVTLVAIYYINSYFFRKDLVAFVLIAEPFLFILFIVKLKNLRIKKFKDDFPDALNLLTGAVSSGQSIMHAFEYVGKQLDNEIGREFKVMAERLLIGESADEVLKRSSLRFPYTEYFFFVSAVRINLVRGGQLKEVLARINKLMFMSRSIEKKRDALTSEARASAKIVAFLPVVFLVILRFTSPENYNFVMFEDAGQPIFYYVIISEIIGFICIWFIIRGVD